ncbi:MAG TPA: AraC family transcriptional regulator, partial [Verrucomicrobiae bacterium]
MTRRQKGEGFPGQRIVVWPRSVIWQAQSRSLLRGLMPTDAGYFPRAKGHVRRRSEPINQAIFLYCLRGRGW